jgi:hypothetical protein
MRILDVALDLLATQRITRLVAEDKITEPIREWVWETHPPSETKLGYFLTCPHCISIWAAGAVSVMSAVTRENPGSRRAGVFRGTVGVLRYTLALSGAVSLGHEVAGKLPTPL